MHELSIIHSIAEAAAEELQRRGNRHKVEAIELKIGALAGIELETIEFLWSAAVADSALDGAELQIVHVPGEGLCNDCGHRFALEYFYDPCPKCNSRLIQITAGDELKIQSLTLVDAVPAASSNAIL